MLIGIDASRATVTRRTGTEGYSLQIIRGLIQQANNTGNCFRLYFRETRHGLFPDQPNVEARVIRQGRLWTHGGLRREVLRDPPDVLFIPSHVIPWPNVGRVPAVVTAHDLGYLHFPEKHPLLERLYLDWSTRHSASTARRVIAVSKATAHDLQILGGVPAEKIRVVYSGVDKLLQPVDNPDSIAALRDRMVIPGPFILHIGRIQPRKNLTRLIEAFARIKDTVEGLTLVLAGRELRDHRPVLVKIQHLGLHNRVVLPGYVPDENQHRRSAYAFPRYMGIWLSGSGSDGLRNSRAVRTHRPFRAVGDAHIAPTDVDAIDALRRLLIDHPCGNAGSARLDQECSLEASSRATLDVLVDAATT
jgi:glycosyltransferase involved in cell wall biosynthesis